MRLLLPIFALVAVIAHQRPDWLRGLISAGGRAATGLAGLSSRFGLGPGRGIGAARAEAAEIGGPSAPLSLGRSAEGRQDAATTRAKDPDLPRPAGATIAGGEPMDGTRGMHEPRARLEEVREQPVRRPSGGGISKLNAPASGNGEERRAGGVANEAAFQST
jgi:hypothetical protein